MPRLLPALAAALLLVPAPAADRPDILLADFEGDTYGPGWVTTGTAFGPGPAKGTLPNQMPVAGFLGKGLVNSFRGGDASTGTLTSPEFTVERTYLNFLLGGGKNPEKLSINLVIGDTVARTATGPNDRPGGSERLDWHTWDVAEFAGKRAVIRIVDEATGGWGHINVDHIVQSDTRKQAEPARREIAVEKRYLHIPITNGAPLRRVKFVVGGDVVREFDAELADGPPDFWAFADLSAFVGKTLTVETTLPTGSKGLAAWPVADAVPDAEAMYREKHRPLFHFTSRRGWLNDPNGLVFHNGEWHLFYQHNPFGVKWGNMHWGHAVSRDLVRWQELGEALYPKRYGDWAFSGSAVVDAGNTSGWGTKEKPPLVLAYTSTGRGECVAYSTDDGRTWTEHPGNPVVKHAGRDPKLVWYEKGKHWVMAVYDEHAGKKWIAFHTSPDLKAWTFASRIEGFYECPDLFELPLDDDARNGTRWVLYGADGKYFVGNFDGKAFTPDRKEKRQLWHGRFYAAQTFDSPPNGPRLYDLTLIPSGPPGPQRPRRIQIGWAQGVTFPGMPFDQQMTVPVELGLMDVQGGPALAASPVRELESLRDGKPVYEVALKAPVKVANRLVLADGLDAYDLAILIDPRNAEGFALDLRGTKLVYDSRGNKLTCGGVTASIDPLLLHLRVLGDRGSIEVFAGFGETAVSVAVIPDEKNRRITLTPIKGEVTVTLAEVYRMKSAWGR